MNYASKTSTYRMGFRRFGTVYQFGGRRRYWLTHAGSCADYGFRITRAASR